MKGSGVCEGLTGSETVFDLYCGIGTISLFLAGKAAKVIGVEEVVPEAVEGGKQKCKAEQDFQYRVLLWYCGRYSTAVIRRRGPGQMWSLWIRPVKDAMLCFWKRW